MLAFPPQKPSKSVQNMQHSSTFTSLEGNKINEGLWLYKVKKKKKYVCVFLFSVFIILNSCIFYGFIFAVPVAEQGGL